MEIRIHFLSYLLLVLCSPGYVVIPSFIPLNSHLLLLWRRWTDAQPWAAAESQVTWSTAASMPLAAQKSCLKKLLWASLPGGWPWEEENLVIFIFYFSWSVQWLLFPCTWQQQSGFVAIALGWRAPEQVTYQRKRGDEHLAFRICFVLISCNFSPLACFSFLS